MKIVVHFYDIEPSVSCFVYNATRPLVVRDKRDSFGCQKQLINFKFPTKFISIDDLSCYT